MVDLSARSGRLARAMLAAILMFALASAGIELTRAGGRIATVWLANGAVLAILIRAARSEWPALLIATLIANLAANAISGDPLLNALILSLCNVLEIGIVAYLVRAHCSSHMFENSGSIFSFTIAALTAPIAPAALASGFLAWQMDVPAQQMFGHWYLADTLGLMMVTPLVFAWTGRWTLPASARAAMEPLAFLAAITVASWMVFASVHPRLFLICPILLFAGFRLPAAWASTVAALSSALAIGFTISGHGPISTLGGTPESQALLLQAFFAVGLILTIPVSAITSERNRLELALTRNERQFRLLAEASPAGILQCGLDGSPLYINARWTEQTGTTLDSLHADGWDCVIAATDRAQARDLWGRVRATAAEASDCLRCDFAGRGAGWAEVFVTPERDPSGLTVGWVVRLMDVTERVDATTALADSEGLYRLLAENARDIIMRLSLDGTKIFVSSAASLLLGIDADEMVGKPIRTFIHPDDWGVVEDRLKTLDDDHESPSIRYRKRRADGQYLWVEAVYHLVRNPTTGEPVEIIASVRDIDLRQKAELIATEAAQKLRESNRLLSMAEELAVVGHWHYNPLSGDLELSPEARSIAGLGRSTLSTASAALAMVNPGDRWRVKRALVASLARRAHARCRIKIFQPDGTERFLDFAVQSEHRVGGGFAGLFGVIHDETAKVADERKLVEALEEARAAANAKSLFLATMSHEIRTPMTGVLGMIDLLRDNPSEVERETFLTTLKQSATLLMAVLNDVLDFSKMEHDRLEIHACDFDLEALAQSTLDLFFNAASQKGLLISLALDPGASPFVHGDPVRIQQVLSNLINNAIKFTDTGSITVRVKARAGSAGTQIWRVEIRDTGIGISASQIDTLFDPFTQADEGTGRRFGGTGLGLAISRRLIEAMGGTLGVDSTFRQGSTFWFELALDQAIGTPMLARPAPAAEPTARPLKVLVAEDNPVNQLLITALLRRQGHRPVCVDDGLKAVDAACADHFDCILMDMQMPVMDGITATRTIRQSTGPCADVPIIALTADASPERRRFYDNAGLTDFMTKPIDGKALAERLAEIGRSIAAPSTESALDMDHVHSLRAALGPTRLHDLLTLFVTELDHRPGSLRDHLLAGRLDQAKAEAHSLKGAAMSVGATVLGKAALAIEQRAVPDNIKVNARLIDALDQAVEGARAALGGPLANCDRANRA
ncbi:MAG: PAS domain S-box protein [Sphingomicrobium sp.]